MTFEEYKEKMDSFNEYCSMKNSIAEMATYIDQDMRAIADETNKQRNKVDHEEVSAWAKKLLEDVNKFCEYIDKTYNTDIL